MESRDKKNQSRSDLNQFEQIEYLFTEDNIKLIEKIEAFPKYMSRQALGKFLTKYEIFKMKVMKNDILYFNALRYSDDKKIL